MPVYEYNALDMKGKSVTGIIDSDSVAAVRQKLRASNIYPVAIKEAQDNSLKKSDKSTPLKGLFSRVRASEVTSMTRQLATLVGAGFPLVTAMDTMIPQVKSQALKKMMARIKDSIVEGNSFAYSLSLYSGIFSPVYINMVRAGETSGTLEIVLERLADITEKQQDLKNRIQAELFYPIFMLVVGIAVMYFLMTFVVPNITSIFKDMNQTLPGITVFLIDFSEFLKKYWWMLVLVVVAIFGTIHSARKTQKGKQFFDKAMLTLPLVGSITSKLSIARFSRTLGSLLENGVSMLQALDIVKNIVGNSIVSNAVETTAKEVGKGQGLGNALAATNVFPSLPIQMIQVGEHTAELETMLIKIADILEKEVESTIKQLTSLLGPMMILIMGFMIGFIVLSICLPIFEMNTLIR